MQVQFERQVLVESSPQQKILTHVTHKQVSEWLREAWSKHKCFPNAAANYRLATAINAIVDRHNSFRYREKSINKNKDLCQYYKEAQKHARALQRRISPIQDNLRFEEALIYQLNNSGPLFESVNNQLSAIAALAGAIEIFIEQFPQPKAQDHMHHTLWISKAVKEAWQSLDDGIQGRPKTRVPMGKKPDDPQVTFIYMALECIGLAGEGEAGNSRDTISEHLRGRQNRPRKRKLKAST